MHLFQLSSFIEVWKKVNEHQLWYLVLNRGKVPRAIYVGASLNLTWHVLKDPWGLKWTIPWLRIGVRACTVVVLLSFMYGGITKSWNLMTSILGQIGSGFYIWCSFLVCIMLNEVCDPCRAWQWTISMLGRAQTPLGSQQRCWHWMAHWGSVCTTLLHCLAFMSAPPPSILSTQRLLSQLARWEFCPWTPRPETYKTGSNWSNLATTFGWQWIIAVWYICDCS